MLISWKRSQANDRARKRDPLAILAVGWLILVLDFSTTGIIAHLFPWLPFLRYDYPFSIAWHGPIIPYMILGGTGLLWLWDRLFLPPTYYRLDSASMFHATVHQAIQEIIDQMTQAKGLRALTELERKPILRDFFQRLR